jgi:MtrB/PioB family decaheme-associated outer membrane protein
VGTSFGFGNVVESPEPIDYRTQDVGLQAEYDQAWGLLRGSFNYNWFTNNIPFHTFDNPFRITDSTDPRAYLGPGSSSIAGPAFGTASLWPDNKAVNGSLGVTFKLAHRTRLSATLGIGQWTQDQQDFIPYTSNTAIETPALPAARLDGKIDTTSLSAYLTTQPVDGLTLAARYRRYEQDNKTGRLTFPGYVRFDGVFEELGRISVPYGNTNDQAQFTATYAFEKVSVEGGWKLEKRERTFRETEDTKENTFLGRVDVRPNEWVTLRGNVEFGSRDYNGLEIELSEEASFLEAGDPANLLAVPAAGGSSAIRAVYASLGCASTVCNLRYDQAAKDVSRYGGSLLLTPGGKASISISYLKGKDDYTQSRYGLINDERETFGLDGDYTFNERANVFAYYNHENITNFQRGRQSGGTLSDSPLDDWTSSVEDKADTLGGGGNFNLVKDKLDFKLNGSYQKVDGNNDLFSPPGGSPDTAESIAQFDDTKLYTLGGELSYKATQNVKLALGGWYEKYQIQDAQTSNLLNYVPASLFLNPIDGDYEAKVVYVRASYVW